MRELLTPDAPETVTAAVRRGLATLPPRGGVLAVSGGRDSMALLHAVYATGLGDRIGAVAVFDHRTGRETARAAALAAQAAERLGFSVVPGRAPAPMQGATEAEWREARWEFLRGVASSRRGRVVTAHTRDDQLETIAHRLWRGAGPRGLAALDVDDGPLRPLLSVSRAATTAYVAAHRVPFLDDPGNTDRRHARVRWRRDLLPAMRQVTPRIVEDLLAIGGAAARWRRDAEALVRSHVTRRTTADGVELEMPGFATVPAGELAWLWPAIVAPHGVVLDRRAIARLGAGVSVGAAVPLAGGGTLLRLSASRWLLMAVRSVADIAAPRPLVGAVEFGDWAFVPSVDVDAPAPATAWHGRLPSGVDLTVRPWAPGDRLVGPAGPRRVKRWLADAGIPGVLRSGWPVVAQGANVWWIPGVRQAVLPPGTTFHCYDCTRRSR